MKWKGWIGLLTCGLLCLSVYAAVGEDVSGSLLYSFPHTFGTSEYRVAYNHPETVTNDRTFTVRTLVALEDFDGWKYRLRKLNVTVTIRGETSIFMQKSVAEITRSFPGTVFGPYDFTFEIPRAQLPDEMPVEAEVIVRLFVREEFNRPDFQGPLPFTDTKVGGSLTVTRAENSSGDSPGIPLGVLLILAGVVTGVISTYYLLGRSGEES